MGSQFYARKSLWSLGAPALDDRPLDVVGPGGSVDATPMAAPVTTSGRVGNCSATTNLAGVAHHG